MILTVKHSAIKSSVDAAFIRGETAAAWLKELSAWSIDLTQLRCYVIPHSISDLHAAGLLVIPPSDVKLTVFNAAVPCRKVSDKLYIPAQAEITPKATAAELDSKLTWDVQFLHPTIGLVGFETEQSIKLADLFDRGTKGETTWSHIKSGPAPLPMLNSIRVEQPPREEMIKSLRGDLEKKDLKDLPQGENDPAGNSAIDKIRAAFYRRLIKSADDAKKQAGNNTPVGGGGSANGNASASDFSNRLQKWAQKRLDEIERRRNQELDRLLDLFNKDPDEALKYALPIEGPYHKRGDATPGDRLSRNPVDFNLRGLGGGQAVDGWDASSHYQSLRRNYIEQANRALENGDHRRAAYIHAHLLANFHAAASALEDGGHFREAAALYKEHLKNLPKAALCLEKAGALSEAASLYDEQQEWTKAGDLYRKMDQNERADIRFERSIQRKLHQNDRIQASALMLEKMQQRERAMQTLRDGWPESHQSKSCLKKYLQLKSDEGTKELKSALEELYEVPMQSEDRKAFLDALIDSKPDLKEDEEVEAFTREIAYEIISNEVASNGRKQLLSLLPAFVPNDKLLEKDVSLYRTRKTSNREAHNEAEISDLITLDSTVNWITGTTHRSYYFAIGSNANGIYMVRGSWEGQSEYYTWPGTADGRSFDLIADPFNSDRILISVTPLLAMDTTIFAANSHFRQRNRVETISWIPENAIGFAPLPSGRSAALIPLGENLSLQEFDQEGSSLQLKDCTPPGMAKHITPVARAGRKMLYRRGSYFAINGDYLLRINSAGETTISELPAEGKMLIAADHYTLLRVAISTNMGVLLAWPSRNAILDFRARDLFAQNIEVVDMLFIPAVGLAVAGNHQIEVFDIKEERPLSMKEFKFDQRVVSLFTVSRRFRFGVLLANGEIKVIHCEPSH